MKKFLTKIKDTLNAGDMDFRIRLFSVMAIGGAIVSFFTVIQSILTSMWIVAFVSATMMILSLGLLEYAVKSGKYQRCYYITIVCIFLFFFPVLFFQAGGYRSGVPAVFIFAVLFTVLMIDGIMAIIFSGIELFVYSLITLIAYRFPEAVVQYASEKAIVIDIIFSYSCIGMISCLVLYFHIKEYTSQRELLKKQNEKLTYYDEVKSTFLTTVAHEIKNPLNIIGLYAQDTYELANEEQIDLEQIRQNQKTVESTVMRVDRILMDLMDTVSIEQGRLTLSIAPMDTAVLIREVVKIWFEKEEKLTNRGNTIKVDLKMDTAPIMADYARIFQVMMNLLSNASLHTEQGTITVTLEKIEDGQRISVQDTGEGMKNDVKENAFKGYVSTSRDYWRHGIGLYICHQIVEAHEGKIWIESELGKGTKISFTLPEKEV